MKVEHIGLYVSDLEAAKRFFVDYFGARAGEGYRNAAKGFASYFLTFDGGARIEVMTRQDENGITHLGLRTFLMTDEL